MKAVLLEVNECKDVEFSKRVYTLASTTLKTMADQEVQYLCTHPSEHQPTPHASYAHHDFAAPVVPH